MKINKDIRNLIMSQPETMMISPSTCVYRGKKYEFVPVTNRERLKKVMEIRECIK